MAKRVLLFILTNLAVVLMLTIVLQLLGVSGFIGPDMQLQLVPLAVFCLVWGMGGAFFSLAISRWMAKRAVGAKLVDGRTGNPELDWLYNTVQNLTGQAGLPMPEVGIYDSPEVNAFATGPSQKRSLVCVSTGLLRSMARDEVEGVLGHEIAHIKNGDMVTMTLLQGVINAVVMFLARVIGWVVAQAVAGRRDDDRGPAPSGLVYFVVVIVLQIVLGILGSMIVAWFSRQREFRADAGGATLAGRGQMVGALKRLLSTQDRIDPRQAALATFKISSGQRLAALFSTHPPLAERIARLEGRA
jgi:heat shock protein HtpX